MSGVAALALAAELVAKAMRQPVGWSWVAMTGLALLGGIQLIGLGLLGEYLGRVYDDVRARPIYLVGESVNLADRTTPR